MGLFGRKIEINDILIVEDEPLAAFDNEYFLKDQGFRIAGTVDRARDAISILSSKPVGLILTDMQLTGKRTGLDVAQAAATNGIPTLLMAATCPEGADQFCLGWIAKPFSNGDLIKAIRAIDRIKVGKKRGRVPKSLIIFEALVVPEENASE